MSEAIKNETTEMAVASGSSFTRNASIRRHSWQNTFRRWRQMPRWKRRKVRKKV